jgi:hypothetical protein
VISLLDKKLWSFMSDLLFCKSTIWETTPFSREYLHASKQIQIGPLGDCTIDVVGVQVSAFNG